MASSIEAKRQNVNNVYRIIYRSGKISKQEIASVLNLSLPTVSQIVSELCEKGVVYEDGYFKSTGGRKAKGISGRMDAKAAIGIDITKNHVCGVLLDLSGKILYSNRIRIPFEGDAEYYKQVKNLINEMLEQSNMEPQKVLGVGVSVPGIVVDNKRITYAPLLHSKDLYEELKDYMEYPYCIINDANAGGFAESWYASHVSQAENVFYLSLSNSVGGAVIMNNELFYGEEFLSGEIGHVTLVVDGRPCYCGQTGCVDSYCSAQVLADLADGDLKLFFERLEAGDEICTKEWKGYLKYLAAVVNNLRNLFNCEVIIGGYVGSYITEKHISELREMVVKRSTFVTDGSFVKSCALKFESSAVGAALHYIDQFIKDI